MHTYVTKLNRYELDEVKEAVNIITQSYAGEHGCLPPWDVEAEILSATHDNMIQLEYFVVYVDYTTIGGIIGMNRSTIDWYVYALHTCYVLPQYKHKGLGITLVNRVIREAAANDAKFLWLSTNKPEYFKKFGFIEMTCYDGTNCLMQKVINPDEI